MTVMKSMEFYQYVSGLSLDAVELGNKKYEKQEDRDSVNSYKTSVANLIFLVNELKKNDRIFTKDDHAKLISSLNAVAGSAKKIKSFISKNTASNIDSQLSAVCQAVSYIDPNKNMSLSKNIDSVEVGNYLIKGKAISAGSNSSLRKKLVINTADNQEVEGYFTSDYKLFDNETGRKTLALMNDFAREHENDAAVRNFVKRVNNVKYNPYGIYSLLCCISRDVNTDKIKEDRLTVSQCYREGVLRKLGYLTNQETINDLEQNANLKDLLIKIRKNVPDAEVNKAIVNYAQYGDTETGIVAKPGSSVAGRSIAMTNVANILGVSNLVAKAVPMTIKEDGKEISGVFMEKAVGGNIDNDNLHTTDFMLIDKDSFESEALKQMADLQVLDYLCQNVDRHYANMLYTVSPEGKITGIQGIDNDTSFGTAKSPFDFSMQNGTPLNEITVMTRGMADKIRELQPEVLEAALSNLGLDEKEITAASDRLANLKSRLIEKKVNKRPTTRYGTIKICEDEDWEKLHLTNLLLRNPGNNQHNIYSSAYEAIIAAKEVRDNKFNGDVDEYLRKREAKYKKIKNDDKFTATTEIDELSEENINENQVRMLNFYKKLIKFEKNQGEELGKFLTLKGKLESLLSFKPEDLQYSKDDDKLTDKEKATSKANRQNMLWFYLDEVVKARKAFEEHLEHMYDHFINDKNHKKQIDHEEDIADFLKRYEEALRAAYLEKVEAELNEISVEVSNEQMQYDTIVDVLATKISEKLPKYSKEKATEYLKKTIVLKHMLEDEGAYQTYYEIASSKDADSLYNIYAAQVMLREWKDYKDDMNKDLYDKITMDNKIAVNHKGEEINTCGEDETFKEAFSAQEHKYNIATSKVEAGRKAGSVNPSDLALVFAERVVMKQLIDMQEKERSDEAIAKAEALVKDADYASQINIIVVDPAFQAIMKELPEGEYTPDTMNRLFDKYVTNKLKLAKANENANENANADVNNGGVNLVNSNNASQAEAKAEVKEEAKETNPEVKAPVLAPKAGK